MTTDREKLLAAADLAASLAHEINNPLTSIINAVYMTSSLSDLPARAEYYLTMARENADRVARIGRQMLALYRKPLEPEAVHVRRLLQDVVEECRPHAVNKHQELAVDLDWPGTVLGFSGELRQALVNLVQNAIDHSPAGETIAIRSHRRHSFQADGERGVRILVSNKAVHPLEHSVERLAPFSSTKEQRGCGLGLWVTRSIVTKNGGRLRVRAYGTELQKVCCAVFLPLRSNVAVKSRSDRSVQTT